LENHKKYTADALIRQNLIEYIEIATNHGTLQLKTPNPN
jgi:hypothetical protein